LAKNLNPIPARLRPSVFLQSADDECRSNRRDRDAEPNRNVIHLARFEFDLRWPDLLHMLVHALTELWMHQPRPASNHEQNPNHQERLFSHRFLSKCVAPAQLLDFQLSGIVDASLTSPSGLLAVESHEFVASFLMGSEL
jgi:hypothetical protein